MSPEDETELSVDPTPVVTEEPLSNAQDVATEPTRAREQVDYQRLDPKWLILERISSAIGYGIFSAIAATICVVVANNTEPPVPLILAIVGVALIPIVLLLIWFWPSWAYHRWSYCVDPKLIELRNGVVWQSSVMVPISRLQHVDMQRGPIERKFGLASLILHTAGTQDATHTIPGLRYDTASSLRDQLVDAANRGALRSGAES